MLFQIKNGSLELGANLILKRIDFEIKEGEKIAIVGRNGTGKTSLLKAICGEYQISSNGEDTQVIKSGKIKIGYLNQNAFSSLQRTVNQEMYEVFAPLLAKKAKIDELILKIEESSEIKDIEALTRLQEEFDLEGGYFYEKDYNLFMQKFGFSLDDKEKCLLEFSGGELTKLAFIKLLLEKPDILLLDEPTNHLDIRTVEWLEEYLKEYRGSVVVVSHDRMFIDKIADTVYEIEYGETVKYSGNYSYFVKEKELNHERTEKAYKAQQAEIARLQALIDRFRETPTKVAMTESKMKQIEKMVKIDEPRPFDLKTFHAEFTPSRSSGKEVLTLNGLTVGYDKPLANLSFKLMRGDRVGIIGPNGIGKSTLVKTLVSQIQPLGGSFFVGYNVDTGYYDQQMIKYESNKNVLNDFWDEFPSLSETKARGALGAFMFTKDDVFKDVSVLSGGERVRLALCKIFERKPNLLILDEPTNHMDMLGKETLEKMLDSYEGSLLFVSHDRYFVKKIAKSLIVFDESGAKYYDLTYDEYMERVKNQPLPQEKPQKETENAPTRAKESYIAGKERSRLERRLLKLGELIKERENELDSKQRELQSPENATDYVLLCSLQNQIDEIELTLIDLMQEMEDIENTLKN